MINNQIFAWDNYEDDPNKRIGLDSIPSQKNATYSSALDGVFTGSLEESFFTNDDKAGIPNPAQVIGEVAMELVEGKGAVVPGFEIHYITSAVEYNVAMGTEDQPGWLYKAGYREDITWTEGMAWAVALVEKDCLLQVTANGTADDVEIRDVKQGMKPVRNMFQRGGDHKYLIVDKGEVFVNDIPMSDVTKIGFIVVA